MQDAQVFVDLECHPTMAELDTMPVTLINNIMLYKQIKQVMENGGVLKI
jgi:hypothetical protein